jgi:hypothetical protein
MALDISALWSMIDPDMSRRAAAYQATTSIEKPKAPARDAERPVAAEPTMS